MVEKIVKTFSLDDKISNYNRLKDDEEFMARQKEALMLGKSIIASRDLMTHQGDGSDILKIENEAQMRFKKESDDAAKRVEFVLESLYKDYEMTDQEFQNPKFKNIKGV